MAVLRIRDVYTVSQIPDPTFSIPDPGSRVKKIPDLGSRSAPKNLSIFNPKNCFYALGNMIWDVKLDPEPGSATLGQRLIAKKYFVLCKKTVEL
jgi:hypothetical protein